MTTRTLVSVTQATNNSGDTGFSYRMRTAAVLGPALGQVRVTFKGSTAAALGITLASVGIWDGVATASLNTNMTGSPSLLTFGVSSLSSTTVAAGGQTTSNWVNLSGFSTANSLVVVINIDGTNGNSRNGTVLGGQTNYYSATASASVANSTKAASTAASSLVEAVLLIEAQATDADVYDQDNQIRTIYKVVAY
jgi:hypothetical protein